MNNPYKYDLLFIRVENEIDCVQIQQELFDLDINLGWRKFISDTSKSFKIKKNLYLGGYPIYLYIFVNEKLIAFNPCDSIDHNERRLAESTTDSHIYTINELNIVKNILRSGRKPPSYVPRRKQF